jgi:glycosyltransferase involved in cell wall biosynthesis
MTLNIIHVSDLSLNGSWFEKLLLTVNKKNISQQLITLNSNKIIFSSRVLENLKIYSPKRRIKIFRYIEIINFIQRARTFGEHNFLFAQGHEESIICSIAARLFGIEFGLVHHVQPAFFPELMKRKRLKGFIHYELYKYYVRRASLIQSLSSNVTDSLEGLSIQRERIVFLGHGINFKEFALKITQSVPVPRKSHNFPTLLMVGRLSWEKNYTLALESFNQLCFKSESAKLMIAGIGPMKNELKEFVRINDLEQRVEFLGYVSNIPRLMIEADALLHLSLSESYGQIYIEACLVDLPIISYPVGIIKELRNMNISEIAILNSKEPTVVAKDIESFCENTLRGRKKRGFSPHPYAIHNEQYVFQEMVKLLEDFGKRAK